MLVLQENWEQKQNQGLTRTRDEVLRGGKFCCVLVNLKAGYIGRSLGELLQHLPCKRIIGHGGTPPADSTGSRYVEAVMDCMERGEVLVEYLEYGLESRKHVSKHKA